MRGSWELCTYLKKMVQAGQRDNGHGQCIHLWLNSEIFREIVIFNRGLECSILKRETTVDPNETAVPCTFGAAAKAEAHAAAAAITAGEGASDTGRHVVFERSICKGMLIVDEWYQ